MQENVDTLKSQRQKLEHGIDRLIDSLAEGVIEKDQFTARMSRTKARIADIGAKIAQASDEGRDPKPTLGKDPSCRTFEPFAESTGQCRLDHQA